MLREFVKVSVVVPVYNVEKYIERCIRSLLGQTLDNIEFVFVDDASVDNSMAILKSLLDEYPSRLRQVKIVSHTINKGLAETRQDGFDIAQGEYIISCDSDDWVEDNMYELMYDFAKKYDADIVCCNYYAEYANKVVECKYSYGVETKFILNKSVPATLNSAVWNKLIRRRLYVENNIRWFQNINMQEDLGVTLRLRILSNKTLVIPEVLYHYNKKNVDSMASMPKLSFINEQIKCADLLVDWIGKYADGAYEELIRNVKFWAKSSLIIHAKTQDIHRWISTFPETNLKIMKYKKMPLYNRIPMWLAIHGFYTAAKYLVVLKCYLSRRN